MSLCDSDLLAWLDTWPQDAQVVLWNEVGDHPHDTIDELNDRALREIRRRFARLQERHEHEHQ